MQYDNETKVFPCQIQAGNTTHKTQTDISTVTHLHLVIVQQKKKQIVFFFLFKPLSNNDVQSRIMT